MIAQAGSMFLSPPHPLMVAAQSFLFGDAAYSWCSATLDWQHHPALANIL
jgi:hypothetical protein